MIACRTGQRVVSLDDLEKTSWNIVLLFGGAMSIGFCLWQTGAAEWLAIRWLFLVEFVPGTSCTILINRALFYGALLSRFGAPGDPDSHPRFCQNVSRMPNQPR